MNSKCIWTFCFFWITCLTTLKLCQTNPGKADLIAEEHHAPGSKAGAQGCSKRGGQARKAAAAVVAVELPPVVTPAPGPDAAGGIFPSSSPLGDFSLSSATFNSLFLCTHTHRHFDEQLDSQVEWHANAKKLLERHWRATLHSRGSRASRRLSSLPMAYEDTGEESRWPNDDTSVRGGSSTDAFTMFISKERIPESGDLGKVLVFREWL